ncbi:MAG: hypothetical protein HXY37_18215, partial [Chloroflexi bacterium]|nr:hypothetical protein [Chloroflexota bacterium]
NGAGLPLVAMRLAGIAPVEVLVGDHGVAARGPGPARRPATAWAASGFGP